MQGRTRGVVELVIGRHSQAEADPAEAYPDVLVQSIEADVKQFVARELHDEVVQTLTTMLLDMERFKRQQTGRVGVQQELAVLQHSVRGALNEIRALLYDLRNQPVLVTDFVESVQRGLIDGFEARTGIPVSLRVSPTWPAALPARAAMNFHRAIQEALNNIRLHASAHSVHIALTVGDEGVTVTVQDDGVGIEHAAFAGPEAGLLGMHERAVLLGGHLRIDTEAGRGTTVRLTVPLEAIR